MRNRILQHIAFWLLLILLNAGIGLLFPAPSDLVYSLPMQFLRASCYELFFLLWKALPFYFIFYFLIPKYLPNNQWIPFLGYALLVLLICTIGHRSFIAPMSQLFYGDLPEFKVYSPNRVFYTFMEIVPIVGLAAAVKLLKGRIATQQSMKALQAEKATAELNFLKAQTHPHFLFNTLNNLYGLARKQHSNTADSILKLSNIMRYVLKECASPRIRLMQEIKIIEDYMALERLRYDDRLKIDFQKIIDDPQTEIAPLILLPFVENAFKHGASETRFEIVIDMVLKVEEGRLDFCIENTCDHAADMSDGIGLQNVKRQLALIYGEHAKLEITAASSRFSVRLTIDLQNHLSDAYI
ncbi:MAG: histidine kinase [Bacteroidota bacterium]